MVQKIRQLLTQYREVLLYLIFGVLTTVINYVVFFYLSMQTTLGISSINIIAWIISVAFAFVTNKIWVFESKTSSLKEYLYEAVKFFGSRLSTLIFELVFMYILVTVLNFNELLIKAIAQVVIIILNYVLSKILVFTNKKAEN